MPPICLLAALLELPPPLSHTHRPTRFTTLPPYPLHHPTALLASHPTALPASPPYRPTRFTTLLPYSLHHPTALPASPPYRPTRFTAGLMDPDRQQPPPHMYDQQHYGPLGSHRLPPPHTHTTNSMLVL